MIKHKLPVFIAGRFLPHRKKHSLILDPTTSSHIYNATYRNFTLVVQKELQKLYKALVQRKLKRAAFKVKVAALLTIATSTLPVSFSVKAEKPLVTNLATANANVTSIKVDENTVLNLPSLPNDKVSTAAADIKSAFNIVEISQEVKAEAVVVKPKFNATKPIGATALNAPKVQVAGLINTDTTANPNEPVKEVEAKFVWPIHGTITTRFSGRHPGIDILQAAGTPIVPAMRGVVVKSGWETGYGNTIIVDHGNGYKSRYAHMSKLIARVGETVGDTSVVGLVGSTGWSTGNHLHFEVYQNSVAIDPFRILP